MTNLALNTQNSTPFNTTISLPTNEVQRMSSKEIAELTGKRHADVIRDIRSMVEQLDNATLRHEEYQQLTDDRGYTSEILLNKDLTTCLVSGYNVQLRMAIIKRWSELEAQEQFRLPTTFSQALLLAAQLEEQKEQLAIELKAKVAVIEVMQPTVDAYELIAGKRGSMCFQDAYKFLGGIKLKEMKKWLFDKNWMYKDRFDRDAISYAYQSNGYLVVKATAHQPQIRITYRGLAAMARQMKIELNAEDFK